MGHNIHNALSFDSTNTNLYLTLILSVSGSGQFTNLCRAPVSGLGALEWHALSPSGFGDYVQSFTFDSSNNVYATGLFWGGFTDFWIISSAKINLSAGTTTWQMKYDDSAATAQGMNIDGAITYLSDDGSRIYYGITLNTNENYFFYADTSNGHLLNSFKHNTGV